MLLLIALLTGCAATRMPYPPTLTVPLPENEFGSFQLDVYDNTGLVNGGVSGPQNLGGVQPVEAIAVPDRSELVISWIGGACSHRPYLEVRGDAQDLDLVIAPQPFEMSLAPVACPAVGILSEVTLTLAEPVEQDSITLTEHR